jgi:hypothetical protein
MINHFLALILLEIKLKSNSIPVKANRKYPLIKDIGLLGLNEKIFFNIMARSCIV